MQCFVGGSSTPILPHQFGDCQGAVADTSAERGNGSRLYELNLWMWTYGRGQPCHVTVTEAEKRHKERTRDARWRAAETLKPLQRWEERVPADDDSADGSKVHCISWCWYVTCYVTCYVAHCHNTVYNTLSYNIHMLYNRVLYNYETYCITLTCNVLYNTRLYSIHMLYNTMLYNHQGMLYNTMLYNSYYNTMLYNTCYIAWCYITCTLLYKTPW
jgi:hypothetical protein